MKYRNAWLCSVLALLGTAAFANAETPSVIAIRNARIVTVSGPVIAKGTIVMRNGLIEAVGASVQAPADAWIVEGEGLTVYPGMIDGLSTLGLPNAASMDAAPTGRRGGGAPPADAPATPAFPAAPPVTAAIARGPEDRPSNTSYLLAADQVSPTDRRLDAARSAGFTSAVTFPNRGIFAGQGAVVNLAGQKAGNMVLESPAGLYLSMRSSGFGSGYPSSIMGVIAYIRQIYLDADQYKTAKEIYATNPLGNNRPAYDKTLEGVLSAPRVLIPASNPKEIERMLRLAQELKLKAVLYGGEEAHRATDVLKQFNGTMLVNLKWPEKARDADPETTDSLRALEMRDKAPSTPAALAKAGVKFAFYAGAVDRPQDVGRAVKRAIDAGLSADAAIRAMTLGVAEIYGVANRLGSLDKGKIANIVVTKGDLFQDRPDVKYVFIDGTKYDPAAETPAAGAEATR
ncbi:MAG: amidohydrolase family protein [Candidatus Solibacter usitatus]|nr:amidohydrolase family protein [Candidatus Solibacter usitatus]